MARHKHQQLVALVRATNAAVIIQAAAACDGHSILDPALFLELGMPAAVVEHLTVKHRSDLSDPKSTLFVKGEPVLELTGVYGLSMLSFLADAFDVAYPRCLGRGSQARAIQQALSRHFDSGTADRPA